MFFAEFYTEEEVTDAKKSLLELADSLAPKPDELKKISKRVGEGKLRRDVEDIFLVFSILDAKKFKLPRFFAADPERIPTLKKFDASDIASKLAEIAQKVSDITVAVSSVKDNTKSVCVASQKSIVSAIDNVFVQTKLQNVKCVPDQEVVSRETVDGMTETSCKVLFSDIVQKSPVASSSAPTRRPFTCGAASDPRNNSATAAVRGRITGPSNVVTNKSQKLIVEQSVREKTWHLFVGKLNKDSTADDLSSFVEDAGIRVHKITKLEARQTWQQNYAAFRVSVAYDDKDKVMEENMWPSSVDVRDWVFRSS